VPPGASRRIYGARADKIYHPKLPLKRFSPSRNYIQCKGFCDFPALDPEPGEIRNPLRQIGI